MKCPRCAADLEEPARFCGVCGFALSAAPELPPDLSPLDTIPDQRPPAGKRAGISREAPPPSWTPPKRPAPARGQAIDPYLGATLGGRFLVEEKLGEGGFGAVYRGTQVVTGRKVALKLLHPDMSRDRNVVARFRREGQVLCSLRDAHTITTYDFDETEDGGLFIAMELLEGRSLHEIFHSEAPIGWRRMLKIVAEMCSSLAEAHSLGIVHRDLKPENIYLEKRPGNPEFVKILDFGIAKMVRGEAGSNQMSPQLTATGQTLGTLEYMSPEQLMGKELDGRSDIYAVGVLIYEMITGHLPFPDAVGPAQLISAQLKTTPRPPSAAHPAGRIPPEVDQVVLRALGKKRQERFADVQEMRAACERLFSGAAAAAQPGGAPVAPQATPTPPPEVQPTPPPAQPTPPPAQPTPPPAQPTPPPQVQPTPPPHVQPTPPPHVQPTPLPQAAPLTPPPQQAAPPWAAGPASASASGKARAAPGPSTEDALRAAAGPRKWVWLVALVAVVALGGAVGAFMALQ